MSEWHPSPVDLLALLHSALPTEKAECIHRHLALNGDNCQLCRSWFEDRAERESSRPIGPPLRPGTVIGKRYRITDKAFLGGQGIVYKAHQDDLDRDVALKMVSGAGNQHESFVKEAKTLAKLPHQNIVPIYDWGIHEGRPYIVMDYLSKGNLVKALGGKTVSPAKAAQIVEILARTVHYVHTKGKVIHRDLKPANILMAENGEMKITDFGLVGHRGGTPGYMAPEQEMGNENEIGPHSDVWALCCILWELLTGKLPAGDKLRGTEKKGLNRLWKWPSLWKKNRMPRTLKGICRKGLKPKIEERYQTAEELEKDLGRFRQQELTDAWPEGRVRRLAERTRLRIGRKPWRFAAMVILAVLFGATAWGTLHFKKQSDAIKKQSDANLELAEENRKKSDANLNLARQREMERNAKEAQRAKAEKAKDESDWRLYASQLAFAQREWQEGDVRHARELLVACRWDFRHWEHAYLNHLLNETQRTFYGHKASVWSVVFSPDGKSVASGSKDKTVKLWDVSTGTELRTLKGHSADVLSVAFSPDGKLLASGSGEVPKGALGEVKVWETATGKNRHTLKHSAAVLSVAFSPDGKLLASGSEDKTVKLWDASKGKELRALKGHSTTVCSVTFSPDGKRLASASDDQTVKFWDVSTGREVHSADHVGSIVVFSPDGRHVACAPEIGEIWVWDADTGNVHCKISPTHKDAVFGLAFSPDGKRLASASADKTIKVWDSATGLEILTLKGHTNNVWSVCFSPDGERLASGSPDQTVKLWDITVGQNPLVFKGHSKKVVSVAFNPKANLLATGSADRTVKWWDAATGQERLTLNQIADVKCVAFSRDGKRFASSSATPAANKPGQVNVWNLATRKELNLRGHAGGILSVNFSPDGKRLASGSTNQTAKVWDADSGKELFTVKHDGWVNSVAFSPDGKWLASGSSNRRVKICDSDSGREYLTLKGHTKSFNCVAFSVDGKRLVSCSSDKNIKVWDTATGKEILTLKGHTGEVLSVAFSSDGKRLISGSGEWTNGISGEVKVWNADTGQELLTLKGDDRPVYSVTFDSVDRRVASALGGKTVTLWDAAMGQERLPLYGLTNTILSVAFSQDGKRIITQSQDVPLAADPQVRAWDAAHAQVRAWDAITGAEIVPCTDPPPPANQHSAVSADGREIVIERGRVVLLRRSRFSVDPKELQREDARRVLFWHQQQAQESENAKQWFAAVFHLRWLLNQRPKDDALKKRLDRAIVEMQKSKRRKYKAV